MGVRTYLVAQVATVVATDRELRAETPGTVDSVHDARVAVRRVRSVLRIFPELSDDDLAEALSTWSDRLGAVREAEVLAQSLSEVCSTALWQSLAGQVAAERAAGLTALSGDLSSEKHRRLLDELEALALRPRERSLHKARRLRHAAKVAGKRLRAAGDDPERLHRARKAAKRARYAAEAVGDAEQADRWEDVQDALGDHHDSVIALRRLDDVPAGLAADAEQARTALRERAAAALERL
ncbi:CHAD domain-containing protein [Nocardioides sp. BP30]|uniref:CHAD domain-containing protein n=1 Tax=Nocardioides sp. BP30 TaxID=3036374 RepID=UPI0024691203|nr:CHAD domain-containing protein [Nocardioides sp. BP30]WGL51061.1 CHAD domain-containing protein [Nocardioides sp. BP30]